MKTCPTCKQNFDDDVDFCPSDGMKLMRASPKGDPLVGTILDGRYLIQEKIGEGGMGSVYRGHQRNIDRPVAIKTLRKTLIDSDEFIERFFTEARIASKINHPNCVTIYDYGHAENDVLYIAMEFLDGQPLSDLAEAGVLSLEEMLAIACDTTRALAAAHTFNVVHRDLKPDNIFVVDVPGGGKNAKVLDFGIAKALDAEKSMTRTGMIFGTPEYMSPEQCAGTEIDGRSDLYSLGCILYEMVGGRTPFRATTPMAVLMAHVNEQAPELEPTTSIPASLERIIFKLLEKNPDKRFATANDLLEALEHELKVLQGLASGSIPMPASQKVTSALAFDNTAAFSTDPHKSETVQSPKAAKKNLAAIAIALVVLIGLAGGAVAVMMGGDSGGDQTEAVETTASSVEVLEAPTETTAEADVPTDDDQLDVAETTEDDELAAVVDETAEPTEEEVDEEPVAEPKTDEKQAEPVAVKKKRRTERKTTPTVEKEEPKKKVDSTTKKKGGTDREYESEMDKMFEL